MHVNISIEITADTNFDDLAQAIADLKAIETGTTIEKPAAGKGDAGDDEEAKKKAKAEAAKKRREKKKAEEAAAKKKAEEEAALLEGDDAAEQPSLDDVKAAVRDYISANDIDAMKKILQDNFKASKLSEVPEEKYAELMGLIT